MLDRAVDVVSLDPQTGEQVTATGFGLSSGTRRRRRAMLRSQDFAQGGEKACVPHRRWE